MSAHVAIALHLLELSSITTSNQTISNDCTRNIFQSFLRKISAVLPICINEKISIQKFSVNIIILFSGIHVTDTVNIVFRHRHRHRNFILCPILNNM